MVDQSPEKEASDLTLIEPLVLRNPKALIVDVRFSPIAIWRQVTASAEVAAKKRAKTGRTGGVWGYIHYGHSIATKKEPPKALVAKDLETKHLPSEADPEIMFLGKLTALLLICVTIVPWSAYVIALVPAYYLYRLTPFLRRLGKSGEAQAKQRAKTVSGIAATLTVCLAVGFLSKGWGLIQTLLCTYAFSSLVFISAATYIQRDYIRWRVAASPSDEEANMPGYSEDNEFMNEDVNVPVNESFEGRKSNDSAGAANVRPIVLGFFVPTQLELEVLSVMNGVIHPRVHHRYLPKNGQLFYQTMEDIESHVIIEGGTRTGKTTKYIMKYKRWLVEELNVKVGTGGLMFDFKGSYDEATGRSGSLNLEDGCDQVFAVDRGEKSARFNPMRVGGKPMIESFLGSIDDSRDSSHYKSFQLKYGSALTDILLGCEKVIAENKKTTDEYRGRQVPAIELPNGKVLRYHPLLANASIEVLDLLISGSEVGFEIAKSVQQMLNHRDPSKVGKKVPHMFKMKRGPEYSIALNNATWNTWKDYYGKVVGSNINKYNKITKKTEKVFAPPSPNIRATFVQYMVGLSTMLTELEEAYGDLLDDSDPSYDIIRIQDCVDGGKIIGFRLSTEGSEAQRMLGKCVLRLYTHLVVNEGHASPIAKTMLILDECATLLYNDEDFARGFLDKAGELGGRAILAYQHSDQWGRNLATLGSIKKSCGNFFKLLPMQPEEAHEFVRNRTPEEKIETAESSESYSLVDSQTQEYQRSGFGKTKQDATGRHLGATYLMHARHETLVTGFSGGRRYGERPTCAEKNLVNEATQRRIDMGYTFFLAAPTPAHPEWFAEEEEVEPDFEWGEQPDYAWAGSFDSWEKTGQEAPN
jgi:hypothetical protein